jgi:uncharacterized protein (TIGR03086 family)
VSEGRAAAPQTSGVALLERAVGYTLGSLQLVTPEALSQPTPCRGWDLRALLRHMDDSLAALQEAVDLAHVALHPPSGSRSRTAPSRLFGLDGPGIAARAVAGGLAGPEVDAQWLALALDGSGSSESLDGSVPGDAMELVVRLRDRACHLLGSWVSGDRREPISIGGRTLPVSVLTSTGAVEIAIHGWDVGRACGQHRPIPPRLAQELLVLASLLVSRADRPARFAPPVPLPPQATPSDHLLAFLGRHPE